VLSIPQIYRIGTMFWDDKYGTQGLSPDVSPYLLNHIYLRCIIMNQDSCIKYIHTRDSYILFLVLN